jgi:hypothetical protein
MNNEKMKGCPFCGNLDVKYHTGWIGGTKEASEKNIEKRGREPSITCSECGIGFSFGFFGQGIEDDYAKKETIKRWNCRKKFQKKLD